MLVQLTDVRVPAATTYFLQVPEYDVPCIKDVWKAELSNDQATRWHVQPMGQFAPRPFHGELERMKRDYGTASGTQAGLTAFRAVYPTDLVFQREWEAAVARATVAREEMTAAANPPPMGEGGGDGTAPVIKRSHHKVAP
jgi:hypothetical protein